MKSMMLSVLALAAGSLFAAVPKVDESSIVVRQLPSHVLTVDYDLIAQPGEAADDCIVTLDILTNGVSIGQSCLTNVSGDVNRVIPAGTGKRIVWKPWKTFGGHTIPQANLTAAVTVWSTNAPPAFMCLNLETLNAADTMYYPSAEAIPGTITNKLYKTKRLLMRRIPAAGVTWRMGATSDDLVSWKPGYATCHYVTLSKDYWMAIFETTWDQMDLLYGADTRKAMGQQGSQGEGCPFCYLNFNGIWGAYGNNINWPTTDRKTVGANSYIKTIRDRTGLFFSVPTRAEWEFACRAGKGTTFNDGSNAPNTNTSDALDRLGWYRENSGGCAHEVGLKAPNAWHLYDMHGNVQEWVLDWWMAGDIGSSPVTDPQYPGAGETSYHFIAGGYYGSLANNVNTSKGNNQEAYSCASYASQAERADNTKAYNGIRLCIPE